MEPKRRTVKGKFMLITLAVLTLVVGMGVTAPKVSAADRDPLLQVLIRKGILTPQEADQIQAEAKQIENQKQETMVKDIQDKGLAVPEPLKGLKFEMLGYVDYSAGNKPLPGDKETSYNDFTLTRGYLTVQKSINSWLGARLTTDITRDASDSWETRVKYLYAELKPGDLGPLTSMKAEVGQGHIPWLDFEEHVNPYRCQGTMAIERAGVFNSADLGVSIRGNIAGKLDNAKAETGNSHYDGRFGTWHIGVYNGGGYHASEKNSNKVLEGRLTLRPMPTVLPGLQFSYFGVYGDGNTKYDGESPDYHVNLGMVSYEHPDFILTAQYFATKGNASGSWVDANDHALNTKGYSFFGTYHLPIMERKLSVYARYDHFNPDSDDKISDSAAYDMYMGGFAYDFYKGNMILLTYETTNYDEDNAGKGKTPKAGTDLGDDNRIQVVYQLKF